MLTPSCRIYTGVSRDLAIKEVPPAIAALDKDPEVDVIIIARGGGSPIELLAFSFLVRKGERLRLEISNVDSMTVEGPMIHWYGLKMGTDTYHHDRLRPSRVVLHERARAGA